MRIVPPGEIDKIKELTFAIYRRYVRVKGDEFVTCIQQETRSQINGDVHAKNYHLSIFDKALSETENFLRMKHAAFVESEVFIEFIQRAQEEELGVESPRTGDSDQESSGDPVQTQAHFLSTVQEEELEGSGRESSQSCEGSQKASTSKSPPPVPPRRTAADSSPKTPVPPARKTPVPGKTKKGTGVVDPFRVVTQRALEATVQQRSAPLQRNS